MAQSGLHSALKIPFRDSSAVYQGYRTLQMNDGKEIFIGLSSVGFVCISAPFS